MARTYFKRILEKTLLRAAGQFPVAVLTGPRQTGKSTLLKKLFTNHTYVTLGNPAQRAAAIQDGAMFIENLDGPAIIDEIQYAPEILSYIKIAVDNNRHKQGQYPYVNYRMLLF
jgi:hypothetical protein